MKKAVDIPFGWRVVMAIAAIVAALCVTGFHP